jgi:hypothetical protein
MHIYTRMHMRMFCFPQQFYFKLREKTNADRNPIAQSAMAPKLVDVSSLGSLVQQANGNYRVRAQVDGKTYQGPWRASRKQAHDDRTKARRATTRADFVGIVQSLSRGGRPASNSQPQKRARKICKTLSSGGAYRAAVQAPSTLSTKRLRRKTPVPNCTSASSSRGGEPTANSVCIMASLLQAATGPPISQSASHDGHVDNHGHDDVDSHHSHDHDHDEHDDHDLHDVQSPSDEVWERVLGEPLNSFAHGEEL